MHYRPLRQSLYYILPLFLMLISGCVYYPQAVDIPLISNKEDLRIDAGISSDVSAHGTVSYGLTDKVAIQGFGRYGHDDGFYFQGAAGLYKKYLNGYVSELYGGYGYGESMVFKHGDQGRIKGNFQLYFLQLNYGRTDRRFANLDYGISLKSGMLATSLHDFGYWNRDYYDNRQVIDYNDKSFVIEPNAVVRIGGKKLKFNLKLGTCYVYKFTNTDKKLPYSKWNVGIGLNYHF
jgi:hypothetical protein